MAVQLTLAVLNFAALVHHPLPTKPPPHPVLPPAAANEPAAPLEPPRRLPPTRMAIAAQPPAANTISLLASTGAAADGARKGATALANLGRQKRLRALTDQVLNLPRSAGIPQLEKIFDGQQMVEHNLTTMLLFCKRRQRWRVASLLAEWAESPDCPLTLTTTHYNLLLSACARRAPRNALHILRRMLARKLDTTVVTFNTAMSAAIQLDDSFGALALFEEMVKNGIEPTTISYNTAINACARGADAEYAAAWASRPFLFNATALPHARFLCALSPHILLFFSLFVCRRALSLFREMEAKGIERSTVTYTGLINACAEGGQLDKAMALFTYMEVAGVERNPVTYCVAINGCTRNGQWEVCAARTGTPSPLRFSFLSHHPSLAPFFFIFPSQTARPPAITRDGAQRHPPRHPSIQRGDLRVREG